MLYDEATPRIPENVALSFSGGGFRAAAFGLGCLSYLETVRLGDSKITDMVRFVSSASGGTFTSLGWTRARRKGQSFEDFYKHFKNKVLSGQLVIQHAFDILKNADAWTSRPDKSRNLINAFAMAYDEIVFEGDALGIYFPAADLTEVCVNTTEFANGEQFRFQNNANAVTGNKFLHFKNDAVAQNTLKAIKLGDILACSSCFTGGFEPVAFPRDFSYGVLTKDMLSSAMVSDTRYNPEKTDQVTAGTVSGNDLSFNLMDGGIDDNQGIHSFMLAEERLQTKNKFGYDLYIACDVSSDYTSGYQFPEEKKAGLFSLLTLKTVGYIAALLFFVSLIILFFSHGGWLASILTGITATLFATVVLVNLFVSSAIGKGVQGQSTFAIIGKTFGSVFLRLPFRFLMPMLSSRGTSTGYLATTVFLKKIRRVSYDLLFQKISFVTQNNQPAIKLWSKFCLQNAVYLLSEKNNVQRLEDLSREPWFNRLPPVKNGTTTKALNLWMEPNPGIQQVAGIATAMATTLWFDQNQEKTKTLEALLATGQFTTCYNLLRYAYRFPSDTYWQPIQEQLLNDWIQFLADPYWLEKK